ncbi:MAG: twin-arginine translocase subunit TatC [Pseudophaeobacter sp. bin_em_oilr2.035]|jgi:sec-independent protein translocase protein TatC|uniref:Sec-independent protein translocase protein TatC n=1 Tax=Phaeobacter gallaeciensis TaxID=60890 RepID=A0ABD4X464_9RHOB|nr:twin-arginine translocase subunit TatC [Phaeobacter gallaeciensis]MDF1770562.1 twin-arginine translocase subunit TatC [Pseudophaeobacter sp. bin_em_oilr2.035]MDE4143100.1 twin-arginine translocase subunit TatC [Phaeobacter gallaeciensis]MDE4156538.1 twin-arginine translocase subunit TatC [Phaeobacter gallaeciensis]MDE4160725.1 twin-arginine translocase subunit TatC [Phaeobacter gallaeciensis]MDE4164181.1 twin-arginine translocase subunit TatC [Phaeobacter gallaeciensis]
MSQTDDIEDSTAPLIEHLAELRTRLIRAVGAFIVGIVLAFTVAEPILQFLLGPIEATLRELGDPSPTLQYTSPQEYLFTLFRISMVFGFALSFPVIGFQLWRFVAPGLYKTEKNAFLPFLIAAPVMFLLGASFAHFVVTPLAMAFFLGFADVSSIFANLLSGTVNDLPTDAAVVPETADGVRITFFGKVNESLDITLKFIMAFGLCFQLPVLLTLMGKAGLVSAEGLGSVRKYAVVAILVLAALVTPPDVITQLILFTVVYGLYEISIFLVSRVEKKREEKLREEGYYDDEDEEDPLMAEFDEDDDK